MQGKFNPIIGSFNGKQDLMNTYTIDDANKLDR
jgi:hypothetical protein